MTGPIPQLPHVQQTNLPMQIGQGASALIGGLLAGRRQQQQDALTRAMQQSLIDSRAAAEQHAMNEERLRGDELARQRSHDTALERNSTLTRIQAMYPGVAGDFGVLADDPTAQGEFGPAYSAAIDAQRQTGKTQTFPFRERTYTVAPKEFTPQDPNALDIRERSLSLRQEKVKLDAANHWISDPTNKVTMALAGNFGRTYAAIESARRTKNPAATNSALLNFATSVDPTMRTAQWTIKKMTDIDPSIMGKWDILYAKLTSGTLPDQQTWDMLDHFKAVMDGVMSDYDMRRQGWIQTHPELEQEVYTPSAEQIFPSYRTGLGSTPNPNEPTKSHEELRRGAAVMQQGYDSLVGGLGPRYQ